jgi:hypothetical protein
MAKRREEKRRRQKRKEEERREKKKRDFKIPVLSATRTHIGGTEDDPTSGQVHSCNKGDEKNKGEDYMNKKTINE